MFKRYYITLFILIYLALPVQARINMLEPWTPGMDFDIPKYSWNHNVNMRMGSDQKGIDLFELGYNVTTTVSPDWELGVALGWQSLNRPSPFKNDSGFNDLTFAGKYLFPEKSVLNIDTLTAEVGFSLPTGDPEGGLGAGGLGVFGGMGTQFPLGSFTGYSQMGLRFFTEGSNTKWGNIFSFILGAQYEIDAEWQAMLDFRLFDHGRDKIDGVKMPYTIQEMYLAPGAIWNPKDLSFDVYAGFLLGLTDESYDYGFMMGAKF